MYNSAANSAYNYINVLSLSLCFWCCLAPVNMKPIKQEILMWQNKAEVLQNKVNELEALNSELRQQVVELTAQQSNSSIYSSIH